MQGDPGCQQECEGRHDKFERNDCGQQSQGEQVRSERASRENENERSVEFTAVIELCVIMVESGFEFWL